MNKLIRIFLWNPFKFFLKIFPNSSKLFYIFKINLINFLSYFGFSNALNRMDKEIIRFFDYRKNGVCLEVGAADGINQSNSLLLERIYDWKVYLVEPTLSQFEICKNYRKKSILHRYAFVSENTFNSNSQIKINFNDLESSIDQKEINSTGTDKENIEIVPTITLDLYIQQNDISHIDIFVLDVEKYEIEVLEGYKKSIGVIDYLLVEAMDFEKFNCYAKSRNWKLIKKIGTDYLFDLNPN